MAKQMTHRPNRPYRPSPESFNKSPIESLKLKASAAVLAGMALLGVGSKVAYDQLNAEPKQNIPEDIVDDMVQLDVSYGELDLAQIAQPGSDYRDVIDTVLPDGNRFSISTIGEVDNERDYNPIINAAMAQAEFLNNSPQSATLPVYDYDGQENLGPNPHEVNFAVESLDKPVEILIVNEKIVGRANLVERGAPFLLTDFNTLPDKNYVIVPETSINENNQRAVDLNGTLEALCDVQTDVEVIQPTTINPESVQGLSEAASSALCIALATAEHANFSGVNYPQYQETVSKFPKFSGYFPQEPNKAGYALSAYYLNPEAYTEVGTGYVATDILDKLVPIPIDLNDNNIDEGSPEPKLTA